MIFNLKTSLSCLQVAPIISSPITSLLCVLEREWSNLVFASGIVGAIVTSFFTMIFNFISVVLRISITNDFTCLFTIHSPTSVIKCCFVCTRIWCRRGSRWFCRRGSWRGSWRYCRRICWVTWSKCCFFTRRKLSTLFHDIVIVYHFVLAWPITTANTIAIWIIDCKLIFSVR
jgi:hypothetical protein